MLVTGRIDLQLHEVRLLNLVNLNDQPSGCVFQLSTTLEEAVSLTRFHALSNGKDRQLDIHVLEWNGHLLTVSDTGDDVLPPILHVRTTGGGRNVPTS